MEIGIIYVVNIISPKELIQCFSSSVNYDKYSINPREHSQNHNYILDTLLPSCSCFYSDSDVSLKPRKTGFMEAFLAFTNQCIWLLIMASMNLD